MATTMKDRDGLKELASLGMRNQLWSGNGNEEQEGHLTPTSSGRWDVREGSSHHRRGYQGVSGLSEESVFSQSTKKERSKESLRMLGILLMADP